MSEVVKFNLEITIPKRWPKKLLQMLDCMRTCGKVGASRTVAFYADGDGDFRPFDFKVDGKEVPTYFGKHWDEHDKDWNPDPKKINCDPPEEFPPPFKTRRSINFFFDAG